MTVTPVTDTAVPFDSRQKERMKERRTRERSKKIERASERESHTRRQILPPHLLHTISDHYTCTRIRSRSARRYERVKKREMPQDRVDGEE